MPIWPILLILFYLISSLSKAAKNSQKKAGNKPPMPSQAAPRRTKLPAAAFPARTESAKKPPKKAAKKQPATMLPEPDYYAGSLNAHTGEGEDTVHADDFHGDARPADALAAAEAEAPTRSPLDFSPDAMVNAIVMQEVLTRPCDRVRRVYR